MERGGAVFLSSSTGRTVRAAAAAGFRRWTGAIPGSPGEAGQVRARCLIVPVVRLVLESDPRLYTIRRYAPGEIVVGDQVLHGPCIVSASRLVADWPAVSPDALDATTLAPLLKLEPVIILIGLLDTHGAPPRAMSVALQRRGIALESMNLGAACRTYNVLVHEGRAVVAGLFPVQGPRRNTPEEGTEGESSPTKQSSDADGIG